MENKDNIDKLFQDKFKSFESNVNPEIWTNVSSQIGNTAAVGSTATTAATGLSKLAITGIITAATAAGIFVGYNVNNTPHTPEKTNKTVAITEDNTDKNEYLNTKDNKLIIYKETKPQQVLVNEIVEQKNKAKKDVSASIIDKNNISTDFEEEQTIDVNIASNSMNRTGSITELNEETELKMFNDGTDNVSSELNKEKEETNTEVLVKKPFGEIKASPVGGFAPLHVSFTSSANTKNVYWDFNDGTTSEEVNPVHVFYEIGVYEVALTVTNRKGEVFVTTTEIEVKEGATLTVPNVFTPNNDRVNDCFVVEGTKIREFNIKILSRTGKVLFESNDINQSWDGKDLNGNDMITGNYVVIVTAKGNDGKQFEEKKIVNLIR